MDYQSLIVHRLILNGQVLQMIMSGKLPQARFKLVSHGVDLILNFCFTIAHDDSLSFHGIQTVGCVAF